MMTDQTQQQQVSHKPGLAHQKLDIFNTNRLSELIIMQSVLVSVATLPGRTAMYHYVTLTLAKWMDSYFPWFW